MINVRWVTSSAQNSQDNAKILQVHLTGHEKKETLAVMVHNLKQNISGLNISLIIRLEKTDELREY